MQVQWKTFFSFSSFLFKKRLEGETKAEAFDNMINKILRIFVEIHSLPCRTKSAW